MTFQSISRCMFRRWLGDGSCYQVESRLHESDAALAAQSGTKFDSSMMEFVFVDGG